MKILLFGEYNRSHWNLKEGLKQLGHEAIVVSTRDGFKKVDVDLEIKNCFESYIFKKIRNLAIRLLKFDIHAFSVKQQILKNQSKLSGYDIVQFINEAPFDFNRNLQLEIFKTLTIWNKNIFLISAGLDYISVKFAYDKKFRYSILTPYFEKIGGKKDYSAALSYLTPEHINLHNYILKTVKGIIATDLDYHIPLIGNEKYLGLISHPINTGLLKFYKLDIKTKIIIFHGINRRNYFTKGNNIFEEALNKINKKYPEKIDIIVAENLPYKEYLKKFKSAHILLDQVFAYDQGFNALEAMAKGKVVFTGAEQEWLDYYNLKEDTVAINALPDANEIAKKLEWLILNPEKILEISNNARAFVETQHNYIEVAKQYLEKWQSKI
jgi:hypothetical protein